MEKINTLKVLTRAMKVPTLVVKTMFGSVETEDLFSDIKKYGK